jgi:hypothetical protein
MIGLPSTNHWRGPRMIARGSAATAASATASRPSIAPRRTRKPAQSIFAIVKSHINSPAPAQPRATNGELTSVRISRWAGKYSTA